MKEILQDSDVKRVWQEVALDPCLEAKSRLEEARQSVLKKAEALGLNLTLADLNRKLLETAIAILHLPRFKPCNPWIFERLRKTWLCLYLLSLSR